MIMGIGIIDTICKVYVGLLAQLSVNELGCNRKCNLIN